MILPSIVLLSTFLTISEIMFIDMSFISLLLNVPEGWIDMPSEEFNTLDSSIFFMSSSAMSSGRLLNTRPSQFGNSLHMSIAFSLASEAASVSSTNSISLPPGQSV